MCVCVRVRVRTLEYVCVRAPANCKDVISRLPIARTSFREPSPRRNCKVFYDKMKARGGGGKGRGAAQQTTANTF